MPNFTNTIGLPNYTNNGYGYTGQGANPMMGGMTNPDGSTNWGAVLGNLFTGGMSLYQGLGGGQGTATGDAAAAAAAADPFATQRGQYQGTLSTMLGGGNPPNFYNTMAQNLLTDPSAFKTDPGYQFAVQQGTEAATRAGNALYGTQRAGAIAPEIAKYVTGYANDAFNTRLGQLLQGSNIQNNANASTLDALLMASGAKTSNPAAAGELLGWGSLQRNAALGAGTSSL